MYSKKFNLLSRYGVFVGMVGLVLVTLFAEIAPASPTLEKTRQTAIESKYIGFNGCGFYSASLLVEEQKSKPEK